MRGATRYTALRCECAWLVADVMFDRRRFAGGNIGLMGEIARTVLETSPKGDDAVIGFIPDRLADREVSGNLLGRTRVVNDMHERKAAMAAEAEAFIAMPGGCGLQCHRRFCIRAA